VNSTVAKLIKIASSLVITGSLGLLGWNLFLHLQGASLPPNLTSLFQLGSLILVAHGVEGAIAAFKAPAHNQKPLPWVVYTFFVGFVGLKELANQKSD
jgi:Domain of unknown function (DUF4499)